MIGVMNPGPFSQEGAVGFRAFSYTGLRMAMDVLSTLRWGVQQQKYQQLEFRQERRFTKALLLRNR